MITRKQVEEVKPGGWMNIGNKKFIFITLLIFAVTGSLSLEAKSYRDYVCKPMITAAPKKYLAIDYSKFAQFDSEDRHEELKKNCEKLLVRVQAAKECFNLLIAVIALLIVVSAFGTGSIYFVNYVNRKELKYKYSELKEFVDCEIKAIKSKFESESIAAQANFRREFSIVTKRKYYQLATYHISQMQYEMALTYLAILEVESAGDDEYRVFINTGICYAKLGNKEFAKEYFVKALNVADNDPDSPNNQETVRRTAKDNGIDL